MMLLRDKFVGNPIWRLLCSGDARSAARALLRVKGMPMGPVGVLGQLPDAAGAYAAYVVWLLGGVIGSLGADGSRLMPDAPTAWIADSDPVLNRAYAGLTLAKLQSNLAQP